MLSDNTRQSGQDQFEAKNGMMWSVSFLYIGTPQCSYVDTLTI